MFWDELNDWRVEPAVSKVFSGFIIPLLFLALLRFKSWDPWNILLYIPLLFFPHPVGGDKSPSFFFIQHLLFSPEAGCVVHGTIESGGNNWDWGGSLGKNSAPLRAQIGLHFQGDFSRALLKVFIPNTVSTDTKFITKGLLFCSQNEDTLSP